MDHRRNHRARRGGVARAFGALDFRGLGFRGLGFRGAVLVLAALVLTVEVALAAPYAAFVMDARTGEVLYSENADTRLHPASLTKMMTLYVTFEAIRRGEISLDSEVKISAKAAAEQPSKLGLKAGQRIQLRYLIRAAAILSANDAATAIGEAISGSESAFAARMTRTAKALGMKNTTFKNAHGLTASGHLSTARDMSILGRRLIYDWPQYYNLFSRQSAHAGVRTVTSHNRLLRSYPGADGIKTGYTNAAGFNLTASAQRGDVRVIATVFGGTSTPARDAKVAELLDLGFSKARKGGAVPSLPPPDYSVPDDLLVAAVSATAPRGPMTRSLVPRPRQVAAPVDDEVLVAIQTGVDAALSDIGDEGPDAAAPAVADAEVAAAVALAMAAPPLRPDSAPDSLPESGADEPGTADAASDEDAGAVALADGDAATETAAETLALAEATAPEAPAEEGEAGAVPVALAIAAPPPRPAGLGPAADGADALMVAQAEDTAGAPAETPEVTDVAALAALADAAPDPGGAQAEPGADGSVELALAAEADEPPPMGVPVPLEALPAPVGPVPATDRGEEVVMAAIEPEVFAEAAPAPEVVTRLSTSGGHHWGVSVGLYGSQYEAERVLLTTALKEVSTLGTALRKVARTPRGFEANFMGLTQDMAVLACGRLQARNIGCTTVGPG